MGSLFYNCVLFFILLSAVVANGQTQDKIKVIDADVAVIPLKQNDTEETPKSNSKTISDDYVESTEDQSEEGIELYDDHEHLNEDGTDKTVNNTSNTGFTGNLFDFKKSFLGRIETRIVNIEVGVDEFKTVISENYPNPYPVTADVIYEWFIVLSDNLDYGIEMIIKDLDFAENDYLFIKPGSIKQNTERQVVLSHYLTSERKYKLVHLNEMYLAFVVKRKTTANTHKGFQVDFKAVGIRPTTEVPTTTVEPPVTVAPKNESTIFIGGKTPQQFLNISEDFRNQLATVAEKYCLENNITIDENINIIDNVNYHLITQCNREWPGSETCVKIIYSIGVSYNNETDEYELTAERLDHMWINYRNHFNFTELKINVYNPPDDYKVLVTWIVTSSMIVLVFAILILVSTKYNCFTEYPGREIMRPSIASQKLSNSSLFPTPHQTVPPFYGMEYYTPEDDQFWSKEDGIAPKYNGGINGQRNEGFVHDEEILDLYPEEIVMDLPDGKDNLQFRMKDSRDKFNGESTL